MNQPRKIKNIIEPQFVMEGAGVRLRRSISPHPSNRFDPFLLFDHFAFNDPLEGPILGLPDAPASRHRNRDVYPGRLGQSPRQPGKFRDDRPRRCAVDDLGARNLARGNAPARSQAGKFTVFNCG